MNSCNNALYITTCNNHVFVRFCIGTNLLLRMYCYKSYLTPVFKSLTSTMYIAAYTLTSNNCNDLMIQLLFKVFKQIHTEVSNKDSM